MELIRIFVLDASCTVLSLSVLHKTQSDHKEALFGPNFPFAFLFYRVIIIISTTTPGLDAATGGGPAVGAGGGGGGGVRHVASVAAAVRTSPALAISKHSSKMTIMIGSR